MGRGESNLLYGNTSLEGISKESGGDAFLKYSPYEKFSRNYNNYFYKCLKGNIIDSVEAAGFLIEKSVEHEVKKELTNALLADTDFCSKMIASCNYFYNVSDININKPEITISKVVSFLRNNRDRIDNNTLARKNLRRLLDVIVYNSVFNKSVNDDFDTLARLENKNIIIMPEVLLVVKETASDIVHLEKYTESENNKITVCNKVLPIKKNPSDTTLNDSYKVSCTDCIGKASAENICKSSASIDEIVIKLSDKTVKDLMDSKRPINHIFAVANYHRREYIADAIGASLPSSGESSRVFKDIYLKNLDNYSIMEEIEGSTDLRHNVVFKKAQEYTNSIINTATGKHV